MDYGTKIVQLRNTHQMTQEELAELMFVSRDLVSKWENNKRRPDRNTLERLCNLFQVNQDYFETANEMLMAELAQCIPSVTQITPDALPVLLKSFLKSLKPRDATIFLKRYYYCESSAQIGHSMHINEVYIRVILSRTRKKLKNQLERRDLN